jgi:hypothetical protein
VITYLSTASGIQDSLGYSISARSPGELLSWLLDSATTTHPRSALRAFWDLDGATQSILSLLPADTRASIAKTNRATWSHYRLFYIPGKMLCANNGSHDEVTFYDLSQYFPDDPEPTSIQQVQQKADLLLQTLSDLGIPSPTKLTSPVAIAEASGLLKKYQSAIPTIFDAPEPFWEAYEYALQCTPREWVSAFQLGAWQDGELWNMDQTSAYPFAASQLIDLRDCSFVKSDALTKSAYYGFLHGDLYINPSHPYAFCSPVVVNLDGRLSNPVGHFPTDYYPLDLIRFVERYEMGSFKMRDGWFISPHHAVSPRQPFQSLMSDLYAGRSQSSLASYFLKRVMAGIIGRMLETRKKDGEVTGYGELYNPIYHAIITSQTKIRVAEFIIQNGISASELVHVGVDGIKSTKRIDLPNKSSRMGQWVCKGSEPVIILSSGRIYTSSRPRGGETYHLLSAMIQAFPNRRRYEFNGSVVDLNGLEMDMTRSFPKLPKTGQALLSEKYQSEAAVL